MKLFFAMAFLLPCTFIKAQEKLYPNNIKTKNLNLSQTIKLINTKLIQWCEKGNIVTVTAQRDGDVHITNKRKQTLTFNLADLTQSNYTQDDKEGIEIRRCDRKSHAPLSWLNFNTAKGNVAFIRLQCNTPANELELIREAFLQLISIHKKDRSK